MILTKSVPLPILISGQKLRNRNIETFSESLSLLIKPARLLPVIPEHSVSNCLITRLK